ncbi:MAG TPA: sensor histidine kinase [Candidatus Corynebacterium gallistercoris]|uniref:histidine kinase n=1 Tax=Candidatus Corynebacterium gallistercoris TaxID=2838530 RepID=A0A9D1UQ26_9CORY|nr:sensor histidine kinase [Candidatus Corynebacterium gallistercoris]
MPFPIGIGPAVSYSSAWPWQIWVYGIGAAGVAVGVLYQQWRPERGGVVVGLFLALVASSALMVLPLGYIVVCYEAYFLSANVRVGRRWWLAVLLGGSYAALLWLVLFNTVVHATSDPDVPQDLPQSVRDFFLAPEVWLFALVAALLVALSIGMMWLWGRGSLRKQEELEAWVARAELATVSERNRIAREMHDIVAHSLTAVIAQADGGRYAGRKDPEKAIEALETIATRGRDALTQMRGLLSVLHGDATTDPRSTSITPGVAGIPELVRDAQRNGVRVQLEVEGEPQQLDEIRDLTVYRIVQESLTNVLKHAGSVDASVRMEWGADALTVRVDNAPGEHQLEGSGRGLTGIRERVRMVGGTSRWGGSSVYPGGWNVTATIPCKKG